MQELLCKSGIEKLALSSSKRVSNRFLFAYKNGRFESNFCFFFNKITAKTANLSSRGPYSKPSKKEKLGWVSFSIPPIVGVCPLVLQKLVPSVPFLHSW